MVYITLSLTLSLTPSLTVGSLEFERYWSKRCDVVIYHFTAFFKGNTCKQKEGASFPVSDSVRDTVKFRVKIRDKVRVTAFLGVIHANRKRLLVFW
jgi:ribosomal protein L19